MKLTFEERMPINVITNIVKMCVVTLIGMWIVPYYISSLGIAAYGIIPLATTVTSYVGIVISAINSACGRYSMIALRRSENPSVSISTSFFGLGKLCLIATPIILLFSLCTPLIFNTSGVNDYEVQVMFSLILISALISSLPSSFRSVFDAKNSIYWSNVIDICYTLIQTALTIMLFTLGRPSLLFIGIAYFTSSIAVFAMTYYLAKREYPDLIVRRDLFDSVLFKSISNLTKWNIVCSLGINLYIQASLIVVNIFLGSTYGGQFALVVSFVSMINTACYTLTHAFGPFTVRYYADHNYEHLAKLLSTGMKFVVLVVAMPLAYVFVFSPQILSAWVGPDYAFLNGTIKLALISQMMYCSYITIDSVFWAFLKVKEVSVVAIAFGIFNIVATTIICCFSDFGIEGAAVVYTISMCLFTISVICMCEGFVETTRFKFLKQTMLGIIVFIVMLAIMFLLGAADIIKGTWASVIISFGIMFVIYIFLVLKLLNKNDKDMIEQILIGRFRKIFHRIFNQ